MKSLKYFTFFYSIILSCDAMAYKQPLHSMMTEFAGQQSVLGRNELWTDWSRNSAEKFLYQKTLQYIKHSNSNWKV